jgi:antitoxin (DNA-binding transcriptional repressor) of toxin-antitoxin stability system
MPRGEQARRSERSVERAERGETVAVLAHGRHVADVVPSGEIERLRETIDVLADNDLLRDLHAGLEDLPAGRIVPADEIAANLRRRSTDQ